MKTRNKPYTQLWYTTTPTFLTKWLRESYIFQAYRFVALSIKMVILVLKGHD